MSKKRKIALIILALVVVIGIAFLALRGKNRNQAMMDAPMPEFETAIVDTGDIEKTIYATGAVSEGSGEEIRSQAGAKVKQVFVQEGQEVKAGDLLYTLDDKEIALTYAKDKLAYEIQAKEYAKEAELSNKPQVLSNVTGEVSEVMVQTGAEVDKETVVAKVVKTDLFELTVPFNSNDVKYLKSGQKVQVFMEEYLSYVDGTINKVDQKGRSTPEGGIVYNVTVEIVNPGALTAGDRGLVEVETAARLIRSIGTSELKVPEAMDIKAGAKGKVEQILVEKGDQVKTETVLLRLDSEAQKNSLEDKKLSLELARMTLAAKTQELENYQVRASVNGKVVELNVEAGKEVPSDKPAAVISNLSGMKMVIQIDEIDIPFVNLGKEATVYTNAFGDQQFKAVVTKIAEKGKIENNSVSFAAELTLQEPGPLKPGMTGDADIIIERKTGILRLPTNAVQIIEDGKGTVMIKGPEGEPQPKEIEIGIEGVELVEIKSGLNTGDEVLIMPGF